MLLDFTIRFIRRIATPAFFTFILLTCAVGSVVYGLSQIILGVTFPPFFSFAFIGLLLSWVLARTRIKAWVAAIFVLIIGFVSTFFWAGNLLPPLLAFCRLFFRWIWAYIIKQPAIMENLTALQLASSELTLAFNTVLVDLLDWSHSQFSENPISHISTIIILWGFTIWLVSAWSGWVYQRHVNTVLSVTPASILLVAILGYTWANISVLLPLLFCILILLALTWLITNEQHWQTSGIDYPADARVDTLISVFTISIILVAIAYFIPKISFRKIAETIREFTDPQVQQVQPFMESLGIEISKPSIGRFGSMLSAGLPRVHLIGAGPELSDQIIMTVQITGGLPPGEETNDVIPLYWRGLTYDQYTGSGWKSSDISLRRYEPDEAASVIERPGYWVVEQEVRFIDDSELLFAAGDLISSNKRFRIAWRSEPRQSKVEEFSGDFFGAATEEPHYRANAFIPVVDEITLRSSSFLYPDRIRENYTLIPVNTSQRVVQHTLKLIDGVDNPYDRAIIIEQYLRQFEYTTNLPLPPEDLDIVDYFLFDLRKGYCDYFATAMVVMARAADLPARLVVGYSRGTYDSVNDRYIVTEADAHSWAEIYFNGVGWVPFEPTSGRNQISRSEQPLEFPGDSIYMIEPDSLLGGLNPLFGSWLITFGVAILGLIWVWMIWITLDEWLLKRLSPGVMVDRIYWRLYHHGRRLGIPALKEATPYEFAESLKIQVVTLPVKSLGQKKMTKANQAINRLTQIYVQAKYSSEYLDNEHKAETLAIWQQLRRQLVVARVLFWVSKYRRSKSLKPESENLE